MDTNNPETNLNTNFTGGVESYERESWKNMLQNFYADTANLFQKEGQLIRAEMNEKTKEIKAGTAALVAGGAVMLVGLMCVAATAIILLSNVTSLWLAALYVTVAFLVVGAVMLTAAKKKFETDNIKPNKSIQAIDEIRLSLKEKVNEITRH